MTLGTHEQPFERLLDLLTPLRPAGGLVIQHGATCPRPDIAGATWFEYAPLDAMAAYMRAADAVVSHAGVGSIMTAIRNGKKPVAVPRRARYGEHVDDHQLQIAERFATAGVAFRCLPGDDLAALLISAVAAERPPAHRGSGLGRAVSSAARGLDRPSRRRRAPFARLGRKSRDRHTV